MPDIDFHAVFDALGVRNVTGVDTVSETLTGVLSETAQRRESLESEILAYAEPRWVTVLRVLTVRRDEFLSLHQVCKHVIEARVSCPVSEKDVSMVRGVTSHVIGFLAQAESARWVETKPMFSSIGVGRMYRLTDVGERVAFIAVRAS